MKMVVLFLPIIISIQAQELKSSLKQKTDLIKRKVSFSADTKGWGQEKSIPAAPIINQKSSRFKCIDVTGFICSLSGSLLAVQGATMSSSNVYPASILMFSGICCIIGGSYALINNSTQE